MECVEIVSLGWLEGMRDRDDRQRQIPLRQLLGVLKHCGQRRRRADTWLSFWWRALACCGSKKPAAPRMVAARPEMRDDYSERIVGLFCFAVLGANPSYVYATSEIGWAWYPAQWTSRHHHHLLISCALVVWMLGNCTTNWPERQSVYIVTLLFVRGVNHSMSDCCARGMFIWFIDRHVRVCVCVFVGERLTWHTLCVWCENFVFGTRCWWCVCVFLTEKFDVYTLKPYI